MPSSRDISERFWNQPQKGLEESRRELFFMDDIIQKAHLEREIERRLDGVQSVLDAGAGAGRFSLWLAARGLRVTHYDISSSMIDVARDQAERQGVSENVEF